VVLPPQELSFACEILAHMFQSKFLRTSKLPSLAQQFFAANDEMAAGLVEVTWQWEWLEVETQRKLGVSAMRLQICIGCNTDS